MNEINVKYLFIDKNKKLLEGIRDDAFYNVKNEEVLLQKKASNYLKDIILKENKLDSGLVYKNEYGKEYLKGKELFYNVSHADNLVISAFSKFELGIDTENLMKEVKNIEKLMAKIANDEDYNFFLENDRITFLCIWIIKEAYSKFIGKGLNINFKNIYIDYDKKRIDCNNERSAKYELFNIDSYLVCVAYSDKVNDLNIIKGEVGEL